MASLQLSGPLLCQATEKESNLAPFHSKNMDVVEKIVVTPE